MQISEENLVGAQHFTFGQLRFLDLDDHVGGIEDLFGGIHDRRTDRFVGGVGLADAGAGIGLHNHFVAVRDDVLNAGRRHSDAKLEGP